MTKNYVRRHMVTAIIEPMKTSDALSHFDESPSKLAKALGMDQSSIYSWGEYPPAVRQLQLEAVTAGALKAESNCDKFRVPASQVQ